MSYLIRRVLAKPQKVRVLFKTRLIFPRVNGPIFPRINGPNQSMYCPFCCQRLGRANGSTRFFHSQYSSFPGQLQSTPDNSNLLGKSKKVRVIGSSSLGSSKQITRIKEMGWGRNESESITHTSLPG